MNLFPSFIRLLLLEFGWLVPLSVVHFLVECRSLGDLRRRFLALHCSAEGSFSLGVVTGVPTLGFLFLRAAGMNGARLQPLSGLDQTPNRISSKFLIENFKPNLP